MGIEEIGNRPKKDAFEIYREMQANLDGAEEKPALHEGVSPGRSPSVDDFAIGSPTGPSAPEQAIRAATDKTSAEQITESKEISPIVAQQINQALYLGAVVSSFKVQGGKTEGKDR